LLQAKAVIQAVCLRLRQLVLKPGFRPKGRALGIKKSQKISTASDQYFLSYVKKLQKTTPQQE